MNLRTDSRGRTRRHFITQTATGMAAFAQLSGLPNLPQKAKRIIYLFQSGGPSQLESFDYKPGLARHANQDLPEHGITVGGEYG